MKSFLISSIFSIFLTICFLLNSVDIFSFFYLVCFINGVLIFTDGVDYLRGRIDTFDPVGVIGVLGYFLFFISPVLQKSWDYWPFVPDLSNENGWMLFWAISNFIGILIYQFFSRYKFKIYEKSINGYIFNINRFKVLMPLALAFSFFMQIYIYSKFGGVGGFVETFTSRQNDGLVKAGEDPFEGMGLPMLIAESFKILIAIYMIFIFKKVKNNKNIFLFFSLMIFFILIFLFFGGLRGSRSSTVFALFFAAGMYHYWIKKITIKFVIIGVIALSGFLTSYYWYKIAGLEGIRAIYDSSYRAEFSSARQDVTKYVVARDLGRMDVQVLALKRYLEDDGYTFSYGRTYATAVFSIVPKTVIPFKPDQITKEKTEILHGIGSYVKESPRQTTLVLGQYGESFINFNILGILIYFVLLGVIARKLRFYAANWAFWDVRKFFLPIFSIIPILMLITDANVIFLHLTRYLIFPLIVFILCLQKVTVK